MGFDKSGVAPGLVQEKKPEPTIHHMKCRNENCKSMQVTEIVTQAAPEGAGASHNRLYQCVMCHQTWSLGVGGGVHL
jgi:hypothetical protein